jgi:hypothetical protein
MTFGLLQQLFVPLAGDLAMDVWMHQRHSHHLALTTNEKGRRGTEPVAGNR